MRKSANYTEQNQRPTPNFFEQNAWPPSNFYEQNPCPPEDFNFTCNCSIIRSEQGRGSKLYFSLFKMCELLRLSLMIAQGFPPTLAILNCLTCRGRKIIGILCEIAIVQRGTTMFIFPK